MSLATDLRTFAKNTGIRADQVVRKVTIDMTRDLVLMTPVDTGHARSNWFFGYQPVTTQDPATSKNGAPSIKRSLEFVSELHAGGVFYIANNVDYIMALEYGHSQKQAPAGMARVTVARFQAYIDGALNEGTRSGRLESMRGAGWS